jgi:hypothetical protein
LVRVRRICESFKTTSFPRALESAVQTKSY